MCCRCAQTRRVSGTGTGTGASGTGCFEALEAGGEGKRQKSESLLYWGVLSGFGRIRLNGSLGGAVANTSRFSPLLKSGGTSAAQRAGRYGM